MAQTISIAIGIRYTPFAIFLKVAKAFNKVLLLDL
jgi:hypothetical protein